MRRRSLLGLITGAFAGLPGFRGYARDEAPPQPTSPPSAEPPRRAFPHVPYEHVTVVGHDALATWERLRARGNGWPVIVGSDEDFERVVEFFAIDDPARHPAAGLPPLRSPEQIVAAAADVHLPDALEALWREEYGDPEEPALLPADGDWPKTPDGIQPGLTVDRDHHGRPFARVHIVVLPTQDSTEAPAYLRWGGWNACPSPEVHVAVLRDWRRRYGVELVGMSSDVLNLRAARRPATREEALALAHEQYFYCSDIVDQGTGTLAPLAAGLMASDWWFFWWD